MKENKLNVSLGLLVGAFLCLVPTSYADEVKRESPSQTDPDKPADNTGVNKRDRHNTEPTAEQQKNNRSDLETARLIRRAVVTDKSLSLYGHNIKIIVQSGLVTLKGPVRSDEEKQSIEKAAAEVAGAAQVKSEIEVTPKK